MIVAKAVSMARTMQIPVLGLVENMSYVKCPDCGKEIPLFGESHIDEVAASYHLDVLARLPIDPKLTALCDKGILELMETDVLDAAVEMLERRLDTVQA